MLSLKALNLVILRLREGCLLVWVDKLLPPVNKAVFLIYYILQYAVKTPLGWLLRFKFIQRGTKVSWSRKVSTSFYYGNLHNSQANRAALHRKRQLHHRCLETDLSTDAYQLFLSG